MGQLFRTQAPSSSVTCWLLHRHVILEKVRHSDLEMVSPTRQFSWKTTLVSSCVRGKPAGTRSTYTTTGNAGEVESSPSRHGEANEGQRQDLKEAHLEMQREWRKEIASVA